MKALDNRMLRRIFRVNRDEVTGGSTKLCINIFKDINIKKKQVGKLWFGFTWLKIWTDGGLL
jgi:hypothetical protein